METKEKLSIYAYGTMAVISFSALGFAAGYLLGFVILVVYQWLSR